MIAEGGTLPASTGGAVPGPSTTSSTAIDVSGARPVDSNQITIAETGVTGANIKDVQFVIKGAQNGTTLSQLASQFVITIVDPLGVSFLDNLYGAAAELGIKDAAKAVFYLELTFTGYDANGAYAGRPLLNSSNGGTWIWGLRIGGHDESNNGIKVTINQGGGIFVITATTSEAYAIVNPKVGAPNPLFVPVNLTVAGSTVKEIFDDFVQQINKAWKDQYNGNIITVKAITTKPVPFTVSRGKDPATFKLTPQEPSKSATRTETQSGKITCHVAQGTSINDFITSTIKNTEEGQALIKGTPTIGDTAKTPVPTITFSVEPDIKTVGQDPKTGIYMKTVTFYVIPHSSSHIIQSPEQLAAAQASDGAESAKVIQYLIDNGFFKKRYDYMYTGKNTEVIDVAIDFNAAFEIALAKTVGARAGQDNSSVNALSSKATFNPQGNKFESLLDLGSATDFGSFLSTLSKDIQIGISNVQTAVTSGIATVQTAVTNGITDVTTGITKAVTPITSAISGGISSVIPSSMTGSLGSINSPLSAVTNSITSKLTAPFGKITPEISVPNNNKYIEDETSSISSTTTPNKPTQTLVQGGRDVANQSGNDGYLGTYHRDKTIVGSIFAQLYNNFNPNASISNGSILNPKITIRGDPYWLGQTNTERIAKLNAGASTHDPNSPDGVSGNPTIQLYFRYPVKMNDTDFRPVLKDSEVFNGIYYVHTITSMFSDGVFKQILDCSINPLGDIKSALKAPQQTGSGGGASQHPSQQAPGSGGAPTPRQIAPGPAPSNLTGKFAQAALTLPTTTQSSNTTPVMGLTADQATAVVSSIAPLEANSYGTVSQVYTKANGSQFVAVGQYQFTGDTLGSLGYVNTSAPGYNPANSNTWTWTSQAQSIGIASSADFLSNADAQETIMRVNMNTNITSAFNNGALNSNSTPQQIAGFAAAAHLGGVGNANGALGNDANGTSPTSYYAVGYNSLAKLGH